MMVQRLLTLMMMIAIAFVSSTSVAAALCGHRDAQQHQAALHDGDAQVAAAAQLEEAAGAVAAKQGTLVDAGAFALPAFILPSTFPGIERMSARQAPALGQDAAKVASLAPRPLLEPPAA
jgi:Na+-transporting NADH:ubiquinone oxidoreductase subunit NqrC